MKIIRLKEDTAEVIVNEGVEFTMDMVDEYHDWIRGNLKHPTYILVNRINSYTYTFETQQKLATIPEIVAIAHIVYSTASKVATRAITNIPKLRPWNAGTFNNHEDALAWLQEQRNKQETISPKPA